MLNKLANMYKYNIKMTKIPFSIKRMKKVPVGGNVAIIFCDNNS